MSYNEMTRDEIRVFRETRAHFSLLTDEDDAWARQEAHPADRWTIEALKAISVNGSFT